MSASSIFDGAAALKRSAGNPTLLTGLIGIFLDNSSQWVEDIRCAVTAGNAKEVRRIAHLLRGAAWTLAGQELVDAAQDLEEHAAGEDLSDATAALATIDHALTRLTAALRAAGPSPREVCR